ncbi:unnamed protein product [Cylicocyclus nassatus]|uniref:Uncharacterized protein n=1 Tax=Cylicocyclus nassatus TaxID=53992 RepID=A0AA36MD37_CYLNA|nr:unnamed protein product [Cylicocyclus nassatus]
MYADYSNMYRRNAGRGDLGTPGYLHGLQRTYDTYASDVEGTTAYQSNSQRGFLPALRKFKLHWSTLFLIVLIVGAALSVVLTVVLTSETSRKEKEPRVMYFSMYVGDVGEPSKSLHLRSDGKECSLKTNKKNTEVSIKQIADKGIDQLYSFIFYGEKVRTTKPKKAKDAIAKLDDFPAEEQEIFNQKGAVQEFVNRKRDGRDMLVHYIPCSFNYSADDEDAKGIVQVLKEAGMDKKLTLVSNTANITEVTEAFNIKKEDIGNLFDQNTNITAEITDIGSKEDVTTTTAKTKKPTTTPTLTTQKKPPSSTAHEETPSTAAYSASTTSVTKEETSEGSTATESATATITDGSSVTTVTAETITGSSSVTTVTDETATGGSSVTTVTDGTVTSGSSVTTVTDETVTGSSTATTATNETTDSSTASTATTDKTSKVTSVTIKCAGSSLAGGVKTSDDDADVETLVLTIIQQCNSLIANKGFKQVVLEERASHDSE